MIRVLRAPAEQGRRHVVPQPLARVEVTKRKAYGAAVPDEDAGEIVDYLTAAYGKPRPDGH